MSELSVEVSNLNHWFGEGESRRPCLTGVSLSLRAGELVVMTGPSGSGKTTFLTLVGALRTVQQGSVRVLGREISQLDRTGLVSVRHQIGFIFQAHNLFDSLSAIENVSLALELFEHTPEARREQAVAILTRLGLGDRLDHKPQALSGGQRQRVAIARALANRPRLVLADEPTAALDKASGREVVEMLKELARDQGSTVILVTHDSRILDVADRIVNMVDGCIAYESVVEDATRICEFLGQVPAFSQTTATALLEISQKMGREDFRAGATVIRQGDEGDKFYVVSNGTVRVLKQQAGAVVTDVELGAGAWFGETALLTGERRDATVNAVTDVSLYTLRKADFLEAMNRSGTLAAQLRSVFFARS